MDLGVGAGVDFVAPPAVASVGAGGGGGVAATLSLKPITGRDNRTVPWNPGLERRANSTRAVAAKLAVDRQIMPMTFANIFRIFEATGAVI